MDRHEVTKVEFPLIECGELHIDPFFNINTPEDLVSAQLFEEAVET